MVTCVPHERMVNPATSLLTEGKGRVFDFRPVVPTHSPESKRKEDESNLRGKRRALLSVIVVFTMLFGLAGVALAATGAIWTTNSAGVVQQNNFADKEDVYLNGGPKSSGSPGLEAGYYYCRVTNPSGSEVLGKTLTASVEVGSDGRMVIRYQLVGILYSAESGYTEKGFDSYSGPYKVWVSKNPEYPSNESATNTFSVDFEEMFYGDILLQKYGVRWSLLETLTLDPSDGDGVASSTLADEVEYKVTISGTWANRPNELVDAKYCTMDGWTTWTDAPDGTGQPELLEVYVDGVRVDWGDYRWDHTYTLLMTGAAATVTFGVHDTYYGDNEGSFTIQIYSPSEVALPGAVFQLYLDNGDNVFNLGDETPAGLEQTTDSSGQTAWLDIVQDDYWLYEVSAPVGYSLRVPRYVAVTNEMLVEGEVNLTFRNDVSSEPVINYVVCGYKFNDRNQDGDWDTDTEESLANWTIHLWDVEEGPNSIIATTTTNSFGFYQFTGLEAETEYFVSEQLKPGWIQTYPYDDMSGSMYVPGHGYVWAWVYAEDSESSGLMTYDFGNYQGETPPPQGTLTVNVVKTDSGNVGGLTVTLTGALNATLTTNSAGTVALTGVGAGTYTANSGDAGYTSDGPRSTTLPNDSSDGVITITLTPGTPPPGPDPANLAGTAYEKDTTNVLAGVSVVIFKDGTIYTTVTTDASGDYFVGNVPVAQYTAYGSLEGYQPDTAGPVTVVPGTTQRLDLQLDKEEIVVLPQTPELPKTGANQLTLVVLGLAALALGSGLNRRRA